MLRKYFIKIYSTIYTFFNFVLCKVKNFSFRTCFLFIYKLRELLWFILGNNVIAFVKYIVSIAKILTIPAHSKYYRALSFRKSFKMLEVFSKHNWIYYARWLNRLSGYLFEQIDYYLHFDWLLFFQLNSFFESMGVLFFDLVDYSFEGGKFQEDSWEVDEFIYLPDFFDTYYIQYHAYEAIRHDRAMRQAKYADSIKNKIWRSDLYYAELNDTP